MIFQSMMKAIRTYEYRLLIVMILSAVSVTGLFGEQLSSIAQNVSEENSSLSGSAGDTVLSTNYNISGQTEHEM